MIIAIDGPAAAGKGTLAQNLAKHFHYAFLDTGRLYRAVGYAVLQAGEDPSDESAATREAKSFDPKSINKILSNPALRDEATGNAASKVAVIPAVRSAAQKPADYDKILADIKERDERDSNRATAPLKPAEDAYVLDTSHLNAVQVFQAALDHIAVNHA